MRGAGQRLARVVEVERLDTSERVQALRLQAEAWRLLALIALTRPDYARGKAQFPFFVTVPFVDGKSVSGFIDQHRDMAKESGIAAGVFAPDPGAG